MIAKKRLTANPCPKQEEDDMNAKVGQAVLMYQTVQRYEQLIANVENKLHRWLVEMTDEEVNAYVQQTTDQE